MRQLGSRYALERIIGRGATGEVWLAHESDGDTVAVKVLRPEFVDDTEVVARFLRERNVVRSVRSPHVVTVRDLVVEGSTLAIVMEYVPRADLRAFLRDNGGVLTPSVAVALTRQVLDALVVVHAAGVVHRDVKPENVLVDEDGSGSPVAKLSDFGVSRLLDGVTLTRVTGLIGTPRYMAPELASGTDPSAASDLYAVGIVLYELLTGRVPFSGEHPVAMLRAHVEQQPQRPKGIDSQLWKVLAKLLAKKPADRYADAAAALRALDEVTPRLDGLPALTDPRIEHTLHPTPRRRHDRPSMSMSFRRRHTHEVQLDGTRHRQHPRLMVGSASFAVIALVAAMFAVFGGSSKDTGERAWIDTYNDTGYAVTRDWQLTGKHGDLFVATERVMPIDHALTAGAKYTLVVPKALARHARDVHISGAQPVKDDPVLAVALGALPLNSAREVRYTIHVAPKGRHSSRLDAWNKEMIEARRAFKHEKTDYSGSREVPKVTASTPDLPIPEQHAAAVAAYTGRSPATNATTQPGILVIDGAGGMVEGPRVPQLPGGEPPPPKPPQPPGQPNVTGLTLDPASLSIPSGQSQTVTLTGMTDQGPATNGILLTTHVSTQDPSLVAVSAPALDTSGAVTFTVQGLGVGTTTITATNGRMATMTTVQVNPVSPQSPTNLLAVWSPSPCVGTCTLNVSFDPGIAGTFAITHYTVCLGGDCGDVTSTSFSVVIGSDGGVGAPFPSPLDPTAWPASISVVAVDATGASSSPPATFALDPSSFPTPPPTPPPSDTGTVTPDTGTTAGPPAS